MGNWKRVIIVAHAVILVQSCYLLSFAEVVRNKEGLVWTEIATLRIVERPKQGEASPDSLAPFNPPRRAPQNSVLRLDLDGVIYLDSQRQYPGFTQPRRFAQGKWGFMEESEMPKIEHDPYKTPYNDAITSHAIEVSNALYKDIIKKVDLKACIEVMDQYFDNPRKYDASENWDDYPGNGKLWKNLTGNEKQIAFMASLQKLAKEMTFRPNTIWHEEGETIYGLLGARPPDPMFPYPVAKPVHLALEKTSEVKIQPFYEWRLNGKRIVLLHTMPHVRLIQDFRIHELFFGYSNTLIWEYGGEIRTVSLETGTHQSFKIPLGRHLDIANTTYHTKEFLYAFGLSKENKTKAMILRTPLRDLVALKTEEKDKQK